MSNDSLTARDLQRKVRAARAEASRCPVTIRHHGQPDLDRVSAAVLAQLDEPTVVRADALSDEDITAFEADVEDHGGPEGIDGDSARERLGLKARQSG